MAYRPLSRKFKAVTSVPDDLQALFNRMAPGKAKTYLGLLLAKPEKTLIGTLDKASRVITLSSVLQETQQDAGVNIESSCTLTRDEFTLAFQGVRATLRFHKLHYGVWSSPYPKLSAHSELDRSRGQIPLWAGIVNKRVLLPAKQEQSAAVA